jgi:hypothetical protein
MEGLAELKGLYGDALPHFPSGRPNFKAISIV